MSTASDNSTERERRYADFLDRFGGNIRRYCIDHSDSLHEAEDLTQDVLAAVWMMLPKMRSESTPRQQNRWLYRLMQSVFVRHLRRWRKGRHRLVPTPVLDAQTADRSGDDNAELLDELAALLPKRDRTMVSDTMEGYSTTEIAVRHGMTPGAVSTQMNRIKKKLKTIYDKLYGEQH